MSYKAANLARFSKLLGSSQHILILQPELIDNDSVGSALGLGVALKSIGKRISHYAFLTINDYFQYLPGVGEIKQELPANFDITILVDCGSPLQLEATFAAHQTLLASKPFVIIDHHASRTAMPFATLDLVDSSAPASGQQIAELSQRLGWQLNRDGAYCLAAAIKSDTLDFSVKAVTPRTFQVAAELAKLGVDFEELRLAQEKAGGLRAEELAMVTRLFERATFYHSSKIAITYLSLKEFDSLKPGSQVDNHVKHQLRRLKEVLVAALVSERKPGYFKISMRANIPVAAATATEFGGGGHDAAASFYIKAKDPQTAVKTAAAAIIKQVELYEAI